MKSFRKGAVRRLVVLLCACALVLPGTSVWATARSMAARAFVSVARAIAPAFGMSGAAMAPSVTATMTGSIATDADSDTKADPGDVIRYRTVITNTGDAPATAVRFLDTPDGHTTLVGGSVVISPLAANDAYASVGNMTLDTSTLTNCSTDALYSVTCNDTLNGATIAKFGDTLAHAGNTTVDGTNTVSTAHGVVKLNTNGTFVYDPAPGFEGNDEFYYTAANTSITPNLTDVGKVTIAVGGVVSGVNQMVWFVNSAAGPGNGTQKSPFNTLAAIQAVNIIDGNDVHPYFGDTIYLYESATAYAGPLTLLQDQRLIGQDATLSPQALNAPAPRSGNAYPAVNPDGATKVSITSSNAASAAVTLTTGNIAAGFTAGHTNSNYAISKTGGGSLAVRDVAIDSSAGGLSILNTSMTTDSTFTGFTSVKSTGGANGIRLFGVGGTVALGTGALSGASGAAFSMAGSSVTATYAGSITSSTGDALDVVTLSGTHDTSTITLSGDISASGIIGMQFNDADGSYTFSGKVTMTGGSQVTMLNTSDGSFNFTNGATSITDPGGAAILMSGGTGSIGYNGSIQKANDGVAIDIQNKTGGTIAFNGAVSSTSLSDGVRLQNNTGATIALTGGMTLNTGTSTAFTATGGGTVNVSGTNNITTTGGTGINWSGVSSTTGVTFSNVSSSSGTAVSIGSSGASTFTFNDVTSTTGTAVSVNGASGNFSFHKIASNGAAKGISVSALTAPGSFTVSGTGGSGLCDSAHVSGTDCQGGTIVGSTARGAEFINAAKVTLNNMRFTGNATTAVACGDDVQGASNTTCNAAIVLSSASAAVINKVYIDGTGSNDTGIVGNAVSGLTVNGLEIANFTNVTKTPMNVQNLTGTVGVTGLNVHNNSGLHTVMVSNNTGTANITFTSPVIQNNSGSGNPDALQVNSYASGTTLNVTATGVNITASSANSGNGVMFQANSGSTMTAVLNGGVVTGTNGILMQSAGNNTSFTYTVNGLANVANHNLGSNGITVGKANGTSGTAVGTVTNNVITAATCGGGCFGIKVATFGASGNHTVSVNNNDISGVDSSGIVSVGGQGSTSLNLTMQGNNIHNPALTQPGNQPNTSYAIDFYAGTQSGDAPCQFFNVGDMTPSHSVPSNRNVITGSWQSGGNPIESGIFNNSVVRLLNYSGSTDAQAAAWISASNGGLGTDTFHFGPNQFAGGISCAPSLLLDTAGGVPAAPACTAAPRLPIPSAPGGEPPSTAATASLLAAMGDASVQRWSRAGLSGQPLAALHGVRLDLADLSALELGSAGGKRIQIDRDAAGKQWFVDPNPLADEAFPNAVSATRLYTTPALAPAGRLDLLTAVLHEMGHELGLEDSYADADRDSLMYGRLSAGERRLPSSALVAALPSPLRQALSLFRPPTPRTRHTTETALAGVSRRSAPAADTAWSTWALGSRIRAWRDAAIGVTHAVLHDVSVLARHAAESIAATAYASGSPVDVPLGTLPAGKSITVVFDVSVDTPPVKDYSNHATVSSTTASFPDTDTETITTDGDRYNTTTAVTVLPGPVDQGLPATITATVTPAEGSGVTPQGTVTFNFGDGSADSVLSCTAAPGDTCTATIPHIYLAGGVFTITATYGGGTNHESSSGTSDETIIACSNNATVTNTNDSGPGSLRDAVLNTCGTEGNNTITFSSSLAGPITLTSGELVPARDLIIQNTNALRVEITRSAAFGDFRIFHINAGRTVTLDKLKITNGSLNAFGLLGKGGGILNEGALTILNSEISGNAVAGKGGGIANSALPGTAATLVLQDSTVSDNTTMYIAGGLVNEAGDASASASATIRNSLFSGNSANDAGAVFNDGTGTTTIAVSNSTISGNVTLGGGAGLYVAGGTATITSCTITSNTANLGGFPASFDLAGGVQAVAGTVTLNNTIVAGNVNATTGADDIHGTLDPASSHNLVGTGGGTSVVDIVNGVNGNQVGTAANPIDPKLGPLQGNGGNSQTHALLPGSPAIDAGDNALVTGSYDQRGSNNFGRIKDGPDADAIATVDIGAFELDPSIEDITDKSMNEDGTPLAFSFNVGDSTVGGFNAIFATSSNTTLVPDADANLAISGSGSTRTLTITPVANQSGTAIITVHVQKSLGPTVAEATDTFVLTVNPVNDPPVIDVIADQAFSEDFGSQIVSLTGIGAGVLPFPAGESQALTITATSDDHAVLADPVVTYLTGSSTGVLSFSSLPDVHGTAHITVTLHDDGGTLDGGVDTFVRTFTVAVNTVADTPSITNATTTEDTQTTSGLVIAKNPADGADVPYVRVTGITNGTLYQNDGSTVIHNGNFITFVQGALGLKFTPAANVSGTASFSIQASTTADISGLGGGVVQATVTVTPVADTPSVTNAATKAQVQTTSGLVVSRNVNDGAEVTHFKITNVQHGTLFLHDGATPVNGGDFILAADGLAGLRFTPADGFTGSASFDVQASTAAGDSGLAGGVATATITVTKHATTTAIVFHGPNPSDQTQPIDVGFVVNSADSGPIPTGTVTVTMADGGSETCAGTVAAGECTLTLLTAGPRQIKATYNGDAANVGSESAAVGHFVSACTVDPVVTSAADDVSSGTLRSAIAGACYGSTITFNIAGAGPHAITLGSVLVINKTMTITGSADGIVISGGDATKLLVIGSAANAALNRLTFTHGTDSTGGALTNLGTLTIADSTFSNNNAANYGGAIENFGTMTVTGSTVWNNTAGLDGGGIFSNNLGTLTVVNSTISGNTATAHFGGGINAFDGTLIHVTVTGNTAGAAFGGVSLLGGSIGNSIVAGNTAPVGPNASANGARPGQNITSGDPMLGPLQDNGGPTFTHMPLPGSPALDAGDDTFASAAGLTTDQRGFARARDSADADTVQTVDIGAVEVDPIVEAIGDKTIDEDGSVQFTFNVGDDSTAFDSLTVISGNTTLLPNVAGHVDVTAATGSRTVTLTPVTNLFGSSVITITATKTLGGAPRTSTTTFTLHVNAVNDPPTLDPIPNPAAIPEDSPQQTVNLTGISTGGGEADTLMVTAISNNPALIPDPVVTYSSPDATGTLAYTPVANKSGTALITVSVSDGTVQMVQTFTVTVTSVPDAPSVTSVHALEDGPSDVIRITRNAADGADVTHFKITNITGGTLVRFTSGLPAVADGAFVTVAQGSAGFLFLPSPNSNATGHFTVQASIGGTDAGLGGPTVTADVVVDPVPDAPSVTPATTLEDTQTTSGLVITPNALDGPEVTHFQILDIFHGSVFKHDGVTPIHSGDVITAAEGAAGLRFTPAPDFSGTADFLVIGVFDAAGNYNGSPDLGAGIITVTAVADTPSFTNAATTVNTQTTSGLVVTRNPVDGSEIGYVKILSVTGGLLYQNDGATLLGNGSFITMAQASAGLRFTPNTNSVTTGHVTIQASRTPIDAGLSGSTVTADIVVGPVVSVTTVTTTGSPANPGDPVTFTATVTPAVAAASGTVQFMDGTTALGTPMALAGGTASFTTSSLELGLHEISAVYSGYTLAAPSTGVLAGGQLIGGGRAILTGADAGGGPHVRRFTAIDGSTPASGALSSFFAFDPAFPGGVRVAEGDVNGDGQPDYIAAAGPGGAPEVRIFDGATGALMRSFLAFEPEFRGGVFVAAGDVNGDGYIDVVAGSGPGRSGQVRVFSGFDGSVLRDEFVFPRAFTGGVRVAAGDVNGDGLADLIAAPGPGASDVTILNGTGDGSTIATFTPYPGFTGGVFVAAGDVTGDGYADVVTGPENGMAPEVRVFDIHNLTLALTVSAFESGFTGGVRVAAGDVTHDGHAEIIVSPGPGRAPDVRVFDGVTAAQLSDVQPYTAAFTAGVWVATTAPYAQMRIDQPTAGSTRRNFLVSGWAFEDGAAGTGISGIDVVAVPVSGGSPVALGAATLGDDRPDVAAIYGAAYAHAGFHLVVSNLAPGTYDLRVTARRAGSGVANLTRVVRIAVQPDPVPIVAIDVPGHSRIGTGPFDVAGWAIALDTPPAPGVDAVQVVAVPVPGGAPITFGPATLGLARPDVGAIFGSGFTNAGYTLTLPGLAPGVWDLHVQARRTGVSAFTGEAIVRVTVTGAPVGRPIITGADAGGGPHVRRFNALDGLPPETGALNSFFAFDAFFGGVRVASGDVNGDGVADIIAGAGPGGLPEIRIFDGASGAMLSSYLAFESSFRGGVFVAAGDVDGDGIVDVIAGSGAGRSGEVKVFRAGSPIVIRDQFVFDPAFTGGVRVGAGDVNGDGRADLLVATGPGVPGEVRVLHADTGATLRTIAPYGAFAGGVFVAAGDVTGDGYADIVTGSDAGGGPHVEVFDGVTGAGLMSFYAFDPSFAGGVRVAAGDVTGDGRADVIVGSGPGMPATFRVFDGTSGALLNEVPAYGPFMAGTFVAVEAPVNRMSLDLPANGATLHGPFTIGGWAFVDNATSAGIAAIHVWAVPVGGGVPTFVGLATLGDDRPDIAALFGAQYAHAGFHLEAAALPPGVYDIAVAAQSAVPGTFQMMRVVRVTIAP